MPTWEARVSRGTAPAERVDAELRYVLAAPLLRDAALWIDLGCGSGVAAGAAFAAGPPAARAVLVDSDAEALAEARRECGAEVAAVVHADLGTADGAAAVREALNELDAQGSCVVTCFGLLNQLDDFTAAVELLLALAADGATVLIGVPDDAAGGLADPHRRSAWSEGAVAELARVLPAGARRLRQVPVRASAIVDDDGGDSAPLGTVDVPAGQAAATHLLAFGPGAALLAPVAAARVADLGAERADVRRRESDLAYLEARVAALEAPAAG
jgi:SAM-dependent methyltransferase